MRLVTAPAPTRRGHPSPPSPPGRGLLVTLFLVYLVLLSWVVLWKLEMPGLGGGERHLKLVPFVASDRNGASQPAEVLGNLLLFIPFGVHLALLAPARHRWDAPLGLVGAAAVSAALETAQYVLAVGRADVTDVIVNTAGAVTGMGLAGLVHLGVGSAARRMMTGACAVGTVAALAACGIVVASPLRYGPPDVVCDRQAPCRIGHDLAR